MRIVIKWTRLPKIKIKWLEIRWIHIRPWNGRMASLQSGVASFSNCWPTFSAMWQASHLGIWPDWSRCGPLYRKQQQKSRDHNRWPCWWWQLWWQWWEKSGRQRWRRKAWGEAWQMEQKKNLQRQASSPGISRFAKHLLQDCDHNTAKTRTQQQDSGGRSRLAQDQLPGLPVQERLHHFKDWKNQNLWHKNSCHLGKSGGVWRGNPYQLQAGKKWWKPPHGSPGSKDTRREEWRPKKWPRGEVRRIPRQEEWRPSPAPAPPLGSWAAPAPAPARVRMAPQYLAPQSLAPPEYK